LSSVRNKQFAFELGKLAKQFGEFKLPLFEIKQSGCWIDDSDGSSYYKSKDELLKMFQQK
jgi:hypothetical protein